MKQRSRRKDMSVIRVCRSNLQARGVGVMALHFHVSMQGAVLLLRETMRTPTSAGPWLGLAEGF